MSYRSYLRSKTRQPAFLWRLGLGILLAGAVLGYAAQWSPQAVTEFLAERSEAQSEYVDQLNQIADQEQWVRLWWAIPRLMGLRLIPGPILLAALTGIGWLLFAIQAGQPGVRGGIRWPLAIVALALGWASIWPTAFAYFYQQSAWGLEKTEDLVGGLRYYILGVGLREELSKLLLFLPLTPWIVRRGSEREALLVAACVGLGFATEENIGYFTGDAGSSIGRFLTANFMHMSLTGLAGLALCRGIWHPRQRGPEAAAIVLLVIVAHGFYDAALMPVFGEYSILGYILFILIAYQFFRELRQGWQPRGETISLTATFITAVSLVAAVTFVYVSATKDFDAALNQVVQPGIASALLVYVFLREVPESLVDV